MALDRGRFRGDVTFADEELALEARRPTISPGKRSLTAQIPVQAKGATLGAAAPAPASGGGREIPADVRGPFESAFGVDLSDVRVHENSPAAQDVGAKAYTQGTDIHFAPGTYDPSSDAGRQLLGHELTHVVQQRSGRVMPQAKGGEINTDAGLEAEADELGARAARGEAVEVRGTAGGIQRTATPESIASDLLDLTYEQKTPAIVAESGAKVANAAVADALETKIRAAAKSKADKEAQRLVQLATQKGRGRKKATDDSFKGHALTAARQEAEQMRQSGSSQDTAQQVEQRAYEAAKASGREAAQEEATTVATDAAEAAATQALNEAASATEQAIKNAVTNTVGAVKGAATADIMDEAVGAVGDPPPASAAEVGRAEKMVVGSALQASAVQLVVSDDDLAKAAKKAAKRQERTARRSAESSATDDVKGAQAQVTNAAVTAAEQAAHDKGQQFRRLRGRLQQQLHGDQNGLGPKMSKVAGAISLMIPDAGDFAEVDALFMIPTGTGVSVTFHFVGSAERAGGPGSKNEDLTTLKMDLMIGAGGDLGWVKAVAELGGYIESCGASVHDAFEQISYATYRRFRESNIIPKGIPNAIWGMGGTSAEDLGVSKDDAKRMEAEEWALGVEERMANADRERDDQGNPVQGGQVGKGAYVEGGLKGGVSGDFGGAQAQVYGFTGRHMRPEGSGDMPSQMVTKNPITGSQKERRGKSVWGVQAKVTVPIGGFASVELQGSYKYIEGEHWIAIDGFGKVNLIGINQWAAFGASAVQALGNALSLLRQAYDASKGKDPQKARVAGNVLGALSATEGMIAEAAGNASGFMQDNASNIIATGASEGFGMGGQSTVRINFENRGGDRALTIMLYQGRGLKANVPGVKASAAAHKRVLQFTILPSLRLEIPGFDLKGD